MLIGHIRAMSVLLIIDLRPVKFALTVSIMQTLHYFHINIFLHCYSYFTPFLLLPEKQSPILSTSVLLPK